MKLIRMFHPSRVGGGGGGGVQGTPVSSIRGDGYPCFICLRVSGTLISSNGEVRGTPVSSNKGVGLEVSLFHLIGVGGRGISLFHPITGVGETRVSSNKGDEYPCLLPSMYYLVLIHCSWTIIDIHCS